MISRKHIASVVLAALAAGCGNFSNEDLEFESGLPGGNNFQVSIPPRSASVSDANEAELAKFTHNVSGGLNALLSAVVNIVDLVRSFAPTSRTRTSRTWGPYPSNEHPGWQTRMVVSRDPADTTKFDYDLSFHRAGGPDTDWPALLSGTFQAGKTARQGAGSFAITTAALRAEGFDPNLPQIDHMEVDYSTADDPVRIQMAITYLPDPSNPAAITSATYDYEAMRDGRHEMTFEFLGDIVPGPMIETFDVTSLWLDSGEGTAMLTVVSGDGQGSTASQCWDQLFRPTYSHKAWAPDDPTLADPSVCPSIAPLF